MPHPVDELMQRLSSAIEAAFGPDHAGADPILRRSAQPQFGDYQANFAMALAKSLGRPPRAVAEAVVGELDVSDLAEPPAVAGPGFVNVRLLPSALSAAVSSLLADDRLGVRTVDAPECVVVDYSSPTLGKELHVGHIRSTVIGDALVRALEFVGHDVVRRNHVGDWGTQFGMLIEYMVERQAGPGDSSLKDLDAFYREASARFTGDPEFADRARARVVKLQAGDPETVAHWRAYVEESLRHAEDVYARLGVLLTRDDLRPESSYNDDLDAVADEIERAGVGVVDQGALVVFTDGFDAPLIVRKRDEGYGYAATDLAAIRHRVGTLHADRVVYVVDARQSQHFAQVFDAARRAGWAGDTALQHVAFGAILGPDRRPFKTRSGENVKLNDVLDEAVERAAAKVREANPDLPDGERLQLARVVAIGALKYADLSNDRVKDYVFDWDRMLAFEGNTGPYLQYAHARIRSIFRRAEVDPDTLASAPVVVAEDAERALVLQLLGFGEAVLSVAETLQPHRLCTYLFDLAQAFTAFYESCPVLRAPDEETRRSRLALCEATARALALGLALLGIDAPDRM
jgi:arginyl-tRNA synthetase